MHISINVLICILCYEYVLTNGYCKFVYIIDKSWALNYPIAFFDIVIASTRLFCHLLPNHGCNPTKSGVRVSHIDGHATAFLFLPPGALWSSQISLDFKIKWQDNMDHFGTGLFPSRGYHDYLLWVLLVACWVMFHFFNCSCRPPSVFKINNFKKIYQCRSWYWSIVNIGLTHISLASFLWDMCKQ